MGRFFQALIQADLVRQQPAEATPAAESVPITAAVVDAVCLPFGETMATTPVCSLNTYEQIHYETGDMPFVEVGGRNIEGSASVLASAGPPPGEAILMEPDTGGAAGQRVEEKATAPAPNIAFQPIASSPPPWLPVAERFAAELVAWHHPEHPVSGQYRDLVACVTAASAKSQVLVFSAKPSGSGTTTVVLNLAITCCRDGKKRVVVVDAHLAAPAVAERLGLDRAPGLAEVLAGTVSLTHALQGTGVEYFHVLTAGKVLAGDSMRLGGKVMAKLLNNLRERFDLILLDAPPWEESPALPALSALADGLYLVARQSSMGTEAPHVPEAPRLRGCVLTRI